MGSKNDKCIIKTRKPNCSKVENCKNCDIFLSDEKWKLDDIQDSWMAFFSRSAKSRCKVQF